ncbi:MAG TPA: hypothetical protein VFV38_26935 [Ktedonobacteraceae bacterium]|nr:hypothetical protein [Ktedonobacteraceae bacterium]
MLPGLDCHTGNPPDFHEQVAVDHWIMLASDDMPAEVGDEVYYSDRFMPWETRSFLPSRVIGKYFHGTMGNGDFAFLHADVVRGDLSHMQRVQPPLATSSAI